MVNSRSAHFKDTREQSYLSMMGFIRSAINEMTTDSVWREFFSPSEIEFLKELRDEYHDDIKCGGDGKEIYGKITLTISRYAKQKAIEADRKWGSREVSQEDIAVDENATDNSTEIANQSLEVDLNVNKSIDILQDYHRQNPDKKISLPELYCLKVRHGDVDKHLTETTLMRIQSLIGDYYPESYGRDFSAYFGREPRSKGRVNSKVAYYDNKIKEILRDNGLFPKNKR